MDLLGEIVVMSKYGSVLSLSWIVSFGFDLPLIAGKTIVWLFTDTIGGDMGTPFVDSSFKIDSINVAFLTGESPGFGKSFGGGENFFPLNGSSNSWYGDPLISLILFVLYFQFYLHH